jgi:DNA-binding transcriptional regulator YhcF (GntR family)
MNEQIKKIVEENYVNIMTTRGMTVVEDGCYIVSPDRLEQYTHAVVKECIAQIALMGISNYENEDIASAISASIKMLKEHFGVKNEPTH